MRIRGYRKLIIAAGGMALIAAVAAVALLTGATLAELTDLWPMFGSFAAIIVGHNVSQGVVDRVDAEYALLLEEGDND